jgi:hypothetical protein
MSADTFEKWKARQAAMTKIILTEPEQYFKQGYTIGEYSAIHAHTMLEENPFCFANAWSPYILTSANDLSNIISLRIKLCVIINYGNLEEETIFKIIDSYPFILEDKDRLFVVSSAIMEKYKHNKKIKIEAFLKSEFALSLPLEIINLIKMNC